MANGLIDGTPSSFFGKGSGGSVINPDGGASWGTGISDRLSGRRPSLTSSGPSYIDPEAAAANPGWAQGQLAQSQWDDFLARYKPLEDETFKILNRDPTAEITEAGDRALQQSDSAQASLQRDTERRGLNVTPEQAMALARKNKLQDSLAVMGAKNSSTRQIAERNLNASASMVSIGRGIAGAAGADLSGASSLQGQRQATDNANEAAADSQTTGLIGTALGLVLPFI